MYISYGNFQGLKTPPAGLVNTSIIYELTFSMLFNIDVDLFNTSIGSNAFLM